MVRAIRADEPGEAPMPTQIVLPLPGADVIYPDNGTVCYGTCSLRQQCYCVQR